MQCKVVRGLQGKGWDLQEVQDVCTSTEVCMYVYRWMRKAAAAVGDERACVCVCLSLGVCVPVCLCACVPATASCLLFWSCRLALCPILPWRIRQCKFASPGARTAVGEDDVTPMVSLGCWVKPGKTNLNFLAP